MNKLEKILIAVGLVGMITAIAAENKVYTIGAMATSATAALTLLVKQRYDIHNYNPFKDIEKK